jgi:hypothetical protein
MGMVHGKLIGYLGKFNAIFMLIGLIKVATKNKILL